MLQLLGWATFEIFVMAQVAAAVTQRALGLELYVFWAVLFAVICRRRPAEAVVHRGHW